MDRIWATAQGSVERVGKYTIFTLSVRLNNGLRIYQVYKEYNEDLKLYPKAYGWILDEQVKELEKRIARRV